MKRKLLHWAGLLLLVLALGACSKPQTPQEVAGAFWLSVIEEDVDDVIEYSTLADAGAYDHFGREWKGMAPTWGKIVIEEREASIVTTMQNADTGEKSSSFDTFLIKDGEVWKVDYVRTKNSVNGGIVGELLGAFKKLGQQISSQFAASGEEFNNQMNSLTSEIRQLGDAIDRQAADAVARHGESLRKHLEALSASIKEALEEQDARMSTDDRETLTDVNESLDESGERLSEPDLDALLQAGELAVEVRQKLATVDARTFEPYQAQWQRWGRQVESDMRDLVEELKGAVRKAGSTD